MKRTFLADGRLRLGWRVLVCVTGFLIVAIVWAGLRGGLREAGLSAVAAETVAAATYVVAALGLVWGLRRGLDRRTWAGVGLPSPRRHLGHVGLGVALGLAMMALVYAAGVMAGALVPSWEEPDSGAAVRLLSPLLAFLVAMAAVAFAEELVFRGYLFRNLAERFPAWVATLLLGLVFGALHVSAVGGATALALLFASAMAVTFFLVLTRLVTGTIWLAVGWHTAWNWLAGALGLFSVREPLVRTEVVGPGWLVGPPGAVEAGALVTAANLAALVLLTVWARRSGTPWIWHQRLMADAP